MIKKRPLDDGKTDSFATLTSRLFRPNLLPPRPHACSRQLCDPLNEIALVAQGHMKGPPLSEHIYLCKFGQIHECGESCGYDEVCPVSGMAHADELMEVSNYDSTNSKTWGERPSYLISDAHAERLMKKYVPEESPSKKAASVPQVAKFHKIDEIYQRIESLIDRLLYSDQRKKINATCAAQSARKSKREKDVLIADFVQREVPWNLIQLLMIDSKYGKDVHSLNILVRDPDIVVKYANYVLQVYMRVQEYQSEKACPDAITLGTLYKMRQGMKVNDVTLIPLDHFLLENLPVMNDLPKFGVNKRKYTKGEQLIMSMFENGKRKGKTDRELAVIFGDGGSAS